MGQDVQRTVHICRHARGVQAHRGNGQRASEIDHGRDGPAVEDLETVLLGGELAV